MITILDGAMGTALASRGIDTGSPLWSAQALLDAPEVLEQLHRSYALAGATVHTAVTFRAQPDRAGLQAAALVSAAVTLARRAVPATHRIAGSLAPVADCYRPDLTPEDALAQHHAMAQLLHEASVNLILVETFANPNEAVDATRAAVATGATVWTSLTPGFNADLLSPTELADAARAVADAGAQAILVNCVPALQALPFVKALRGAVLDSPIGVYANAGLRGDPEHLTAEQYLSYARAWYDAGCSILGGCCGTDTHHIQALSDAAHRWP